MQLTVNYSNDFFSKSILKPFLLFGVATVSSAALYSPLSAQTSILKNSLNKSTLEPIKPTYNKVLNGSKKLLETLGNWTKIATNNTEKLKKWLSSSQNWNLSNGTKEIISTLNKWIHKIYEFLNKLLKEDIWNKFVKNLQLLENILNLFKNIMKAEINGKRSILSEFISHAGTNEFGQLINTLGEIATENPKLLEQMDDKFMEELSTAFKGDPEETTKILESFSKKKDTEIEELKNALKPNSLIGKIQIAIEKAKKLDENIELPKEQKQKEATEILKELQTLKEELSQLIKKSKETLKKK